MMGIFQITKKKKIPNSSHFKTIVVSPEVISGYEWVYSCHSKWLDNLCQWKRDPSTRNRDIYACVEHVQ